ncbi:MCE-family protein [Mycolicibacterium conceptionense]|uniref:MCE-family protein n=1 Tax=Mycolicibacterium conceptionense TaxID=451644 RepID=A0A0U1DHI2_9MYCO|nr:MCE family protein [Mycolicibacterium conceptionense]ORV24635.1 MCE-family protein [Mycolicibacterium conceptionense]CQD16521.1 MCE-family protein [Mycolicibacterium conceptionense]
MTGERRTRTLTGAITVLAIVGIVTLAVAQFRGAFTKTVEVKVIAARAGLVMNPGAKVKMLGVQLGKVSQIDYRPDGTAALALAMDPAKMAVIPDNVTVDISSSTVFGAKFVDLVPPPHPSAQPLRPGQQISTEHVTVELNTVFQRLTTVLDKVEPEKLNETLGAIAAGLDGRGAKMGQMLSDLNAFLAGVEPTLPTLSHEMDVAPVALNAYAEAAPDLMKTVGNAATLSQSIVEEQDNLNAVLLGLIGLADAGNDVLGSNRQSLTDLLRTLVPTTNLTSKYRDAINCSLAGIVPLTTMPATPDPGILVMVGFTPGAERYRYPSHLPKVAATGGPHCMDLPNVPAQKREPFLVTDVGANPAQYGNPSMMWNTDALKQYLFGPLDGPPRNSAQIGQPG